MYIYIYYYIYIYIYIYYNSCCFQQVFIVCVYIYIYMCVLHSNHHTTMDKNVV